MVYVPLRHKSLNDFCFKGYSYSLLMYLSLLTPDRCRVLAALLFPLLTLPS